jgi:nitrous oxidase accessory protein
MLKIIIEIIITCLLLSPQLMFAKTILVGNSEAVKTIREALKLSNNGDIIKLTGDIYYEHDLIIEKQIKLIGGNFPILNGSKKTGIILVKADNVLISGIYFKDSGMSFVKDYAAVKLDSVANCTIKNNKFDNNFFGIYLGKSWNCTISGNEIKSSKKTQTYSGNGIHLWYCKNIIIENNIVEGHRDGIYLEFVRNSKIVKNVSHSNLRYGLHFMFSDSCEYSYNRFEHNSAGVAVMFTHHVNMNNNVFQNNWGDASYGLLLKDITDGKISNNKFIRNTCGIYIEGSNRNTVKNNSFESNGWAIRLMANSMDNIFTHNNFKSNSFEVTTNSIRNFNTFEKNYWSDYQGYDIDNDGIGEVPHHPVKLFSLIVEQNRSTLLLLRSFFVELLDAAEKIFPVITPETLIDKYPLMSMIK